MFSIPILKQFDLSAQLGNASGNRRFTDRFCHRIMGALVIGSGQDMIGREFSGRNAPVNLFSRAAKNGQSCYFQGQMIQQGGPQKRPGALSGNL